MRLPQMFHQSRNTVLSCGLSAVILWILGWAMNGRERILALMAGQPVDRPPLMPVNMMFASDLIGARYRDYVLDHRVMVEGQIRTAERFDFDHVSCMSDPCREVEDCGATVQYFDNQPPALDEENALLADPAALLRLRMPVPEEGRRMSECLRVESLLKERVGREKLVLGWVEGPCAEGADLRGINRLMLDFMDEPQFVRDLFEFVVQMELRYAQAQIQAGADQIGIGDAAASLVGPDIYEEFILPFEKKSVDGLHALGTTVRMHICGNIRPLLRWVGALGCEIVDIDSPVPFGEARHETGPGQILLGNVDTVRVMRDGTPAEVTAAVRDCHRQAGSRYVVGAGCEIPRDTPHANVQAMTDYVRQWGAEVAAGKGEPVDRTFQMK